MWHMLKYWIQMCSFPRILGIKRIWVWALLSIKKKKKPLFIGKRFKKYLIFGSEEWKYSPSLNIMEYFCSLVLICYHFSEEDVLQWSFHHSTLFSWDFSLFLVSKSTSSLAENLSQSILLISAGRQAHIIFQQLHIFLIKWIISASD